jgi:DNA polymerase-3 subunit delta'
MAETEDDPREVPWHPRFARKVIGHDSAVQLFEKNLAAGKPHHAWLLNGPKGIGKATLAYQLANRLLGQQNPEQARRWIEGRAHPDLFVLERQLNDAKPRKLKTEISVDDARGLSGFLNRTSSSGWRVAIVDAVDDLNSESANSLLKLVEEPPNKALIFLINHVPGQTLRTLKSRCMRIPLEPLKDAEISNVIKGLNLDGHIPIEDIEMAARISGGSPGQAVAMAGSIAAKAFDNWLKNDRATLQSILKVGAQFTGKNATSDEFDLFINLLLAWVAEKAKQSSSNSLAGAYETVARSARITNAYNLDRRQTIVEALVAINDALKAA